MMFIDIDAPSGAARSVAAAGTIRAACRRRVYGRQMSGGKGAKGGNPFSGPYSGAQVLIEGLRGSANRVAEIAGNAEIAGTLDRGSGNCANPLGCRYGRCFGNAVAGAGGVAESAETPSDDSARG